MPGLDLTSIIIVSCLMSGLLALVLFAMRRSYPPHIHGLGYWAAAAALWFATTVMFLVTPLSGVLENLVIYLGNLLLLVSNIVYLKGMQRFEDTPAPWRRWIAFLGVMALLTLWLTFGRDDFAPRLVVMIVGLTAIYLSTLLTALRYKEKRLPIYLIAAVLSAHILVIGLRLVSMGGIQNFYEQSLIQSIYVASFVIAQMMYSIGAILLATDRLARENQRQAHYDALTEIRNRRSLLQCCEEELARARRSQRDAALMIMDIDHFKRINDTHGHQHGDEVLRHFARQVGALLRPQDHFGRYGGEEFVVMLPETDAGVAHTIAARIHAALDRGHVHDCKLSIGVTAWRADDSLETMLARADRALYEAKAQGRNQTCAA